MKYIKYLWYVIRHKWFVFVECVKLGIPLLGIKHDLSKFKLKEFLPYVNYFYGKEKNENKFDLAWLHHQNRNKHHWQYWILQKDNGGTLIKEMPLKYKKEMLADWRGAGKAINGKDNTRKWYLKNKSKMKLHPKTAEWVENKLQVVYKEVAD